MKRKPLPQAPSTPDRVYVPAAYVAQACGLAFLDLENRLRPDDWATPRDFIYTRRGMFYAETSLPRLADHLEASGQAAAAGLLRAYSAKIAAAQDSGGYGFPEEGKLVAVEKAAPGGDLDLVAARHTRRHASDREELPKGWAHSWEEQHE